MEHRISSFSLTRTFSNRDWFGKCISLIPDVISLNVDFHEELNRTSILRQEAGEICRLGFRMEGPVLEGGGDSFSSPVADTLSILILLMMSEQKKRGADRNDG